MLLLCVFWDAFFRTDHYGRRAMTVTVLMGLSSIWQTYSMVLLIGGCKGRGDDVLVDHFRPQTLAFSAFLTEVTLIKSLRILTMYIGR
jgi:hypothetical protein